MMTFENIKSREKVIYPLQKEKGYLFSASGWTRVQIYLEDKKQYHVILQGGIPFVLPPSPHDTVLIAENFDSPVQDLHIMEYEL